MSPKDRIIEHVSEYITLTPAELDYFTTLLKTRKIRKKSFLLQAGDVCRHKTFVASGCLRGYFVDRQDKEHIIRFAVENWWIEDLQSFITGEPTRIDIDALEDSEVVQIDKPGITALLEKVPKFETFFRVMLQRDFISLQKRIVMNLSMEAKERYRLFLKNCNHLNNRIAQHQVASFLGITPQFLSYIRNERESDKNENGIADSPF